MDYILSRIARMNISYVSIFFYAFLFGTLLVYYTVPKKMRSRVLLIFSMIFYICFDVRYVLFLLFTALSTFITAKKLPSLDDRHKKSALFLCTGANALVWFVTKDLAWLFASFDRLLGVVGINFSFPALNILVPAGISYYTLQAIGYLTGIYKGDFPPEEKFGNYLLFLSYFPAIVQGPISRYDKLMPQLLDHGDISHDDARCSLLLILFGFIKKKVIADRLGIFTAYCFSSYASLRGVILYVGALCYAIQLYTDFSGCVDICRGVSGLFGIDLVNNFNRPYFSLSVKEFWNRWHISLSSWLRDHIYIPLGGNRKGNMRKYINVMATFLVSGIWHGAGFNFILWGMLHAAFQIIGEMTRDTREIIKERMGVEKGSFSEKFFRWIITFNLVTFAWIFFRGNGLSGGLNYVVNMLSESRLWVLFDGSLFTHGVNQNYFLLIILHVVIMFVAEHKNADAEESAKKIIDLHIILRWSVYMILILDVVLFGAYGSGYSASDFMYGGF